MERGWKPSVEVYPTCPRCGSSNTKFCYYNNYSMTQPRYFCKGCRRYWTKGGSLRNIPVGGGCRKTRRGKSIRISDTVSSRNFLARGDGGGGGGGISNGCCNAECGDGNGGSSSSTAMPNGTNIDLAQVYANFLNQRPEMNQVHHHDQIPTNEVDPMSSFGFSCIPNMELEYGAANFGSAMETYVSEGGGLQLYGCSSIFTNHQEDREKDYFGTSGLSNYGLPPLPGEDFGWSGSNIGYSDQVLDPVIESEGQELSDDPLIRRRKSSTTFDMATTNYDTIFMP